MQESAKFKKRPVIVNAIQFTNESLEACCKFVGTSDLLGASPEHIEIKTLEGSLSAKIGDYIVRGIKGEHYPVKPDIFAATYELQFESAEPEIAQSNRQRLLEIHDWNAVKSVKFWICPHDPNSMCGKPIGQYHCPVCGAMVVACCEHPPMVLINEYHLEYDGEEFDKWRNEQKLLEKDADGKDWKDT